MANIVKTGHAGGRIKSRTLGIKVVLAGRTTFLPNSDAPILVQRLTLGQINAIPKDRFAVSLVEPTSPVVVYASGQKSHGHLSGLQLQRLRRLARMTTVGGTTRYIRHTQVAIASGVDGTKLYTTIIASIKDLKQNADELYYLNRRISRNLGGEPPEHNLFYEPIDEGLMSDCIMKAIVKYFGDSDKCILHGYNFKLADFCLLIHYYFIRIGILKTTARKPFCEYILDCVLMDWDTKFTPKTFNNYAKENEEAELEFTSKKRLEIDFSHPPTQSDARPFLKSFHEIGNFFHRSEYFEQLRTMRKHLNDFDL